MWVSPNDVVTVGCSVRADDLSSYFQISCVFTPCWKGEAGVPGRPLAFSFQALQPIAASKGVHFKITKLLVGLSR